MKHAREDMVGSVEDLTDESGKVRGYLARWRERSGQGRKKTFLLKKGLRKKDAENHVIAMESAKSKRQRTSYDEKVTIAGLVSEFLDLCADRDVAEGSIKTWTSTYKSQIKDTPLGRTAALDGRWTDVQSWASKMRRKHSRNYTIGALTLVRSALAMAVKDERIPDNYARHTVDVKREAPTEIVPLEIVDVQEILAQMDPRRRIVATVQAQAGPRACEALGLLRREIDLDARVIRFREQIHQRRPERVPLKTESSVRDVPIGARLAADLERYFEEHPRHAGEFAFVNARGLPWTYPTYSYEVARAAKAAGFPGMTTHDLRHHFASVLIAQKVQLLVIARLLGHKGVKMLETTYGHLLESTDTMARDALDGAWNASPE